MMRGGVEFIRPVHDLGDLPCDGLPEVCISGRSNVGKSSLINQLAGKRDLARTSQRPGMTRALNYYSVGGRFFLVDLPGYGYAKVPKTEKMLFARLVNPYLEKRREIRGIIQLLDSRHGPVSGDHDMLEWLAGRGGKVLYVMTKTDKLTASERAGLRRVCDKEYGAESSVLFSARTGAGLGDIVAWIEAVLGG